MGVILLLTILGTFIVMQLMAIDLQIISLGALILALGMLVDNAIVVTEGILVRVQQGSSRVEAALTTVNQTAWPLLGATFVAVLAFAGIGTSQDVTGEFLKSLFLVMAISLGLSWVLAVTLTPLFCVLYMGKQKTDQNTSPYDGKFFQMYRSFLDFCLSHRILATTCLIGVLAASVLAFGLVENSFFPGDTRNQFLINVWRPEGTHIYQTSASLEQMENYLAEQDEVSATTTFVGQGSLRFMLSYDPQMPNTSYGQILVTVKDYRSIDGLIARLRDQTAEMLPDAQVIYKKMVRGRDLPGKIEVKFQGPDIAVLRQLSAQAQQIIASDPVAIDICDNWRQRTLVARPQVAEATARRLGITRPQIADILAMNFSGKTVGVYREENKLIPMMVRTPLDERGSVDQMDNLSIISPVTGQSLPLKQIVSGIKAEWEDPIIRREDRMRTLSVYANPVVGHASVLQERLQPKIEAMQLPSGYSMEWGGEYQGSKEAQEGLFSMIPIFFLAMVFVVLALFNAVRQTIIIFLCLPLATIGVTTGLLVFREPFGFMCLLGFLGLSGMLIKNAVVLIDQIDLEIREGKDPYTAILDSAVSRLRPVSMAALTTVLGMLPLLADAFFSGMSVTIIGGLTFGTVLTLVVVPVLYASFFRINQKV
jgi:multidrug efflux pump subunit AcrB